VPPSKRHHRLLTALFSDGRNKARFELLIAVEGVVFWNIAAVRATRGHSIKVASQTTDIVMSPKTREALTRAYHVARAESLKSILGEGLKPGHELFLEGGRNEARLLPFAPSDKRSREIIGKRLRDAGTW
jgi:RNA:NAD 2'-phosphotransferase (TPT1/KptA family)